MIPIYCPEHCWTTDSAAGDPFLIYFTGPTDEVHKWLSANVRSDWLWLDDDQYRDFDGIPTQQIAFSDAMDALAFMAAFYRDGDMFGIEAPDEELAGLLAPLCQTPTGYYKGERVDFMWGLYER